MSYFNKLPNLEYISPYKDSTSNSDYLKTKNIFIRAKIREDILSKVSAIHYYYIEGNERPEQIAEKVYGSSEFDWIVLLTNNIIDLKNEWPLDNQSFEKYLIDKYGSEERLTDVHHYETIEIKDQYNRQVISSGFKVDSGTERNISTTNTNNSYEIPYYQNSNLKNTISINLNQYVDLLTRNNNQSKAKITDIFGETSILKIYGRDQIYDIKINNDYSTWPSGWGGSLIVYGRNENYNLNIQDELGDVFIQIPSILYEIIGKEVNNEVKTFFNFIQ